MESRCFLEKEFIELISMNPCILFYLIVYQVDSCIGFVCSHLT